MQELNCSSRENARYNIFVLDVIQSVLEGNDLLNNHLQT